MTFLTGTGRHRVQITHFFRGQIGSWRPLGVDLVVGKRLHRLRHRCSSLEVSEPRPALNLLKLLRELAKICCKRRRVRCRRLHATTADPKRTPGDLRAANRQDSIGAAVMAGRSISRIKKYYFFRPPVSVPLISLDQYRTERYSDDCMASRSSSRRPAPRVRRPPKFRRPSGDVLGDVRLGSGWFRRSLAALRPREPAPS